MDVIAREAWGAAPPRQAIPRRGWTAWIVLHHTAGPNKVLTPAEEAAYCRQMQASHFARGWADIGQHYTVMRSGRIYACRGEVLVGSHCPGRNSDSIGIETQGTFIDGAMPSEEQIQALGQLVGELCRRYGLDPARAVTYHRRWYATQCPGDLVRVIPRIVEIARGAQVASSIEEEEGLMESYLASGTAGAVPLYVGPFRGRYTEKPTRHMGAWANFVAGSQRADVRVWWTDADGRQASAVQQIGVPPNGKRGIDLWWLAGSKALDGVLHWKASAPVQVQIDRWIT